ncbi:MAG: hypothetical protein ACSLFE_03720 [Gemmatimonadaceae bacterium]
MMAATNAWSAGAQHGTCELQDGRPIAGEIAEIKLCRRCIDVALYLGELERERVARLAA